MEVFVTGVDATLLGTPSRIMAGVAVVVNETTHLTAIYRL